MISADNTIDIENPELQADLIVEYIYILKPANLPPAKLQLAVGNLIMLLRNLYFFQIFYNETRLLITHISRFCIEGKILNGE